MSVILPLPALAEHSAPEQIGTASSTLLLAVTASDVFPESMEPWAMKALYNVPSNQILALTDRDSGRILAGSEAV